MMAGKHGGGDRTSLFKAAGLLAAVAFTGCLAFLMAGQVSAAPFRPLNDGEVVERLPGGTRVSSDMRAAKAALSQRPGDFNTVLRLARLYIAEARAESDPRFHGYAEALLEPWLDSPDPPREALVLDAILKQARHDFPAALSVLQRVLRADPRHGQARLAKAMVERAQGRYDAAAESCLRLDRRLPVLVRRTCRAAVESLTGGTAKTRAALEAAFNAAPREEVASKLWALTVLGEIAALAGDGAAAEAHFRTGLALGQRDIYLLAALADLLLQQGRNGEVLDLLADDLRPDPLLLRLAIAAARADDAEAEDYRRALSARFDATRRRGDMRHLREEARFMLHLQKDPGAALELALANWRDQREPWDLRLVLEAAAAAGRPAAAAPALAWIEQVGFEAAWLSELRDGLEERGS